MSKNRSAFFLNKLACDAIFSPEPQVLEGNPHDAGSLGLGRGRVVPRDPRHQHAGAFWVHGRHDLVNPYNDADRPCEVHPGASLGWIRLFEWQSFRLSGAL